MTQKKKRSSEQQDLEDALPRLIEKLGALRKDLPEPERTVLDEIILSAARHTEFVNADDVSAHGDKLYMKPMSVHVTHQMREEMLVMPRRLGIEIKDWQPKRYK